MYRVVVERSAEKDLRKLQLDVRFRVADALRSLANDPRPVGSRKLAGTKHDWRVRSVIAASSTRSLMRFALYGFIACGIVAKPIAEAF